MTSIVARSMGAAPVEGSDRKERIIDPKQFAVQLFYGANGNSKTGEKIVCLFE